MLKMSLITSLIKLLEWMLMLMMRSLRNFLVITLGVILTVLSPALFAETFWNNAITTNNTDTISTRVGTVDVTIEDLDNNIVQVIAMVNTSDFPAEYKIDNRVTFKETQGSSYEMVFAQAVDNPVIAIGSLGNGGTANRFTLDSVDGVIGTLNISFADAWSLAAGSEGAGTVGNLTSYGPSTYGTSKGIGTESNTLNLDGVTFYESKEGNIVARVNATGVTKIRFSLSNAENYMTLMMGYDSAVDAARSSVSSVSPSSVYADNTNTSTVTVTMLDNFGNTMARGGETVTIHSDLGTVSGVTDNNNGTYTATVKSNAIGTANITATVNGTTVSGGTAQTVSFTDPPPTLSSTTPDDNATGVALNSNVVLKFSKNVVIGSGNLVIKKTADNSVFETILVTSSQITGSGTDTITINPSTNLTVLTEYYLLIDAVAFDDNNGLSFAGVSNTTNISFTTINDATPPTVAIGASNSSSSVANGSTTDDASLSVTFTLSEAVGSSPNDFVAADIALTNATLGNDFACASLVCTVTLFPTATGLVTVNVAAASFKDVAGNDNLLATQFSWTYGVDPTQKESVTSLLQGTSSISKELKNNNIKAVYNRLAWLNRNVDQKNKSHQGVRVTFTDPLFDEYFNGSRGPDLDVTVGDAMIAVKRYDDNPDFIAVEAREQSRILVASTARTNLGSVNLNPTADAFYKNWYVWTSGTYTVGGIDATTSTDKQESTGQALSIGVDRVFGASGNIMGFALTYGDDHIKMGTNGSKIDSASYSVSTYSQYKIANLPKFEILLGTGQADMAMERVDGSQTLTSAKKSTVVFGSVGMRGQTYKQGKLLITPYGQLESAYIKLPSTNEAGGSMALAYSEQILRENTAAIGINLDFEKVIGSRSLRPYGKLQLARDYSSDSGVDLNYIGNSTIYSIAPSTGQASKWTIAMGADYILSENAKAAISVESTNSSGSFLNSARIELNAAF